jgi:hypothetical protein
MSRHDDRVALRQMIGTSGGSSRRRTDRPSSQKKREALES